MGQGRKDIVEDRAHTDASLGAERASTDAATELAAATAQRVLDGLVECDRVAADERLLRFRESADSALAQERLGSPAQGDSVVMKRHGADDRKGAEREATDALLGQERRGADAVVELERRAHEAHRAAHQARRHDTNSQLSIERTGADATVAALARTEDALAQSQSADLAERKRSESVLQETERQLDLSDLLTGMDKMLQRILGADVALVSIPTQPLGRVRADPSSVEQVIMNLVVNARDAMPRGGKLTIETANVVLDDAYAQGHLGLVSGPHVMLAVSDTGTGMDQAIVARIFEPFFTTKAVGKGTGLGLSTVFGIVQQSGGSVWVYSEVGNGTTFKVYLPCVDEACEAVGETVPPTTLRGSETILLVEDDDQVRVVAGGILRRSGYHVIEARNAGEALLHCEEHAETIHVLLTDVVMPQMSGPALAKRLVTARPDMKVLCMSGYTDDSIVRHGVLEAHVAYLQKPFTPDTLTAKVRDVLDGAS